jgi:DNA polymerase-3 subunit delta'
VDDAGAITRGEPGPAMTHAWLITGPPGSGRSTAATNFAAALVCPEDGCGVCQACRTAPLGGHSDVEVIVPEGLIYSIDDTRELVRRSSMAPVESPWRVIVIEDADRLGERAVNVLLKSLEEPTPHTVWVLCAPSTEDVLPTIRSRCRELRLHALAPEPLSDALTLAGGDVSPEDTQALSELAGGSVGEAFRLTNLDGLKLYAGIVTLLSSLPRLDRPRALALAESGAGRGAEAQFDLILTLLDLFLTRLARAAAIRQLPLEAAPGEADLITRLAQHPQAARIWAELAQSLSIRARRGKAVNLDPAALLMDMVLKLEETAGPLAHK